MCISVSIFLYENPQAPILAKMKNVVVVVIVVVVVVGGGVVVAITGTIS